MGCGASGAKYKTLVAQSDDTDAAKRKEACDELGNMGKQAFWIAAGNWNKAYQAPRTRGLRREDSEDKGAAKKYADCVAPLLSDKDARVRESACKAFQYFGVATDPHIQKILVCLKDEDTAVCREACKVFGLDVQGGERGGAATAPSGELFVELFQSKDPETRKAAINAISNMYGNGVQYALSVMELNGDPDADVAEAAKECIRYFNKSYKAKMEECNKASYAKALELIKKDDQEEMAKGCKLITALQVGASEIFTAAEKDAVVKALMSRIDAPQRKVREKACCTLGAFPKDMIKPHASRFAELLNDSEGDDLAVELEPDEDLGWSVHSDLGVVLYVEKDKQAWRKGVRQGMRVVGFQEIQNPSLFGKPGAKTAEEGKKHAGGVFKSDGSIKPSISLNFKFNEFLVRRAALCTLGTTQDGSHADKVAEFLEEKADEDKFIGTEAERTIPPEDIFPYQHRCIKSCACEVLGLMGATGKADLIATSACTSNTVYQTLSISDTDFLTNGETLFCLPGALKGLIALGKVGVAACAKLIRQGLSSSYPMARNNFKVLAKIANEDHWLIRDHGDIIEKFLQKAMTEGDVTKSATFGGTEDDVKCGLTVLALLGTDGKKYEGIVMEVQTNTNGRLKEEVNRCLREIGLEPIPDV